MASNPMAPQRLLTGRAFLAYVWRRYVDDRCLEITAELSYISLLALVPLAAIVFAVLAAVPVFEGAHERINQFLFENLLPDTGKQVVAYFDSFVANAGELKAVGIAGLVVTAVILLSTIETAFNTIFRVVCHRPLWSRLVVYMVLLTLGPIVLGASMALAGFVIASS